ncbi:MAG TPA: hypothetical protein DCR70_00270 [Phycisphaerales bacterium]|nr:hypothetical protein [Phycisphaerales bacterium]
MTESYPASHPLRECRKAPPRSQPINKRRKSIAHAFAIDPAHIERQSRAAQIDKFPGVPEQIQHAVRRKAALTRLAHDWHW